MSSRHQGRHRIAEKGPGRRPEPVEQRPEGRHRTAAGQPMKVSPLLAAGGGVAAALTAILLSGAQGPLGALFSERVEDPRPTTASASPRNGSPKATDITQMASFSPAPGSRSDLSVWDMLFQQDLSGPGATPAMLDDGSADAVGWTQGAGLGAGGTPSFGSAGVPATLQPAPVAGVLSAAAPLETPTSGGGEVPPGSVTPPPAGSVMEPVTTTVEEAPETVAPVTETETETEPVTRTVEEAPETVAPVTKTVQRVTKTVEEAPETVAPVKKTVERAPETVAPVKETVEEAPKEVEETSAKVEKVTEKAEEEPVPTESPAGDVSDAVDLP